MEQTNTNDDRNFNAALDLLSDNPSKSEVLKAIKYLKKSLENGNSHAAVQLGRIYYSNLTGTTDLNLARHYYQKAADLNNPKGMFHLALMIQRGEIENKTIQDAIDLYKKALDGNVYSAAFYMALIYQSDKLGTPNWQNAIDYYTIAANKKHTKACYNLGLIYETGKAGHPDIEKAVKYYRMAEQKKDPAAAFKIARLYQLGKLGEINQSKIIQLYEKAFEYGSSSAAFNLALIYLYDKNVEKDFRKAVEYLQEAAKKNHPRSIRLLAELHEDGEFGKADYIAANELYQRLAKLGDDDALISIGINFASGRLGKSREKESKEYFKEACEKGHPDGAFFLAVEELNEKDKNIPLIRELLEKAEKTENSVVMYWLAEVYKSGDLGQKELDRAQLWFIKADEAGHPNAYRKIANKFILQTVNSLKQGGIKKSLIKSIDKNLESLEKTFFSIRKKHSISKPMTLSHFTSWSALESILSTEETQGSRENKNCLRQYLVEYMNDPTEGQRLLSYIDKNGNSRTAEIASQSLKKIFKKGYFNKNLGCGSTNQLLPSVFITSLTKDSDRLDLWRAYGRDGDGYCLSFKTNPERMSRKKTSLYRANQTAFATPSDESSNPLEINENSNSKKSITNNINQHTPFLYEIKYTDESVIKCLVTLEKPISRLEKLIKKMPSKEYKNRIYICISSILLELLYMYKDEQYSTEREVRALRVLKISDSIVHSDERVPGRLYIETTPFLFTTKSTIIVGPKVHEKQAALWNLRWRLNKLRFTNTTAVRESSVSYR